MQRKYIKLMILLSLLGVLITSYLIYVHYKPVEDSLCSISDKMDCNSVNKSQYSGFFGSVGLIKLKYALGFDIPVALLGLLTYSILFILAIMLHKKIQKRILHFIFALSLAGFLFSLYLAYIEAFVLRLWCLFCILQAVIVTILFLTSIVLLRSKEF